MSETEVAVFLVDDEAVVTNAARWLLESVGIAAVEFNDPDAFLAQLARHEAAACVVLDLRMPRQSGMEVLKILARDRPDVAVLFLSAHGDVPSAVRAMQFGAIDFIQKPFNPQEFLEAVAKASTAARERHAERTHRAGIERMLGALSPREREVLQALLEDRSSKEIARALGISPKTVEVHRGNIMKKLDVPTYRGLLQRFRGAPK
jgi:RNA polymerase sigma factor (sigma-70 family)